MKPHPYKDRRTSEALEIQFLPKAIERVPPDKRKVAIDAGANVGNWAFEMAKAFATVVAFEPVGYTFATLRERINAEGMENRIWAIQAAVMDVPGTVEMITPGKSRTSTAYYAVRKPTGVESVTLDSMAIEQCGLLKLDLEGAELRALVGAVELLARCRPVLVVEVIEKHLSRFGDTPDRLHAWLMAKQYLCVDEQAPNRLYVPC